MKQSIILSLLLLSSYSLFSQSVKEKAISRALAYEKESLDEIDFSTCLEMNQASYLDRLQSKMSQYLDRGEIKEWMRELDAGSFDDIEDLAYDAREHALTALLKEQDISEDEYFECQAQQAESYYQEVGEKTTEDFLKAVQGHLNSDVNVSSLGIELPVYPRHKVVSYFDENQSKDLMQQMSPGVTIDKAFSSIIFATDDEYSEVMNYYKSRLGGFKVSNLGDETVLWSESEIDFDEVIRSEDWSKWAVTQTVWVEKIDSEYFPGKVKIEIHFE